MKLRKLFLFLTAILTLGIFITGCKKQEVMKPESINESYTSEILVSDLPELEVIDEMLYFENVEQFFTTIDLLSNASSDVVREWENRIGFKSLKTIQEEALEELQIIETDEAYWNWKSKYKNLFEEIINNEGEIELNSIIQDNGYACICNTKQLYTIINNVYSVTKNELIIVPIAKKEQLLNNQIDDSFIKISISPIVNSKVDKPTAHTAIAIVDRSGCNNDRKVKIKNYVQHYYIYNNGRYYYTINVVSETKGYRKTACVWRPYKTQLSYKNVEGEIKYNRGNSEKDFRMFDKYSYINTFSISSIATLVNSSTTSSTTVVNILTDVYFTENHGESSSRGVGSLWAVINYNLSFKQKAVHKTQLSFMNSYNYTQ